MRNSLKPLLLSLVALAAGFGGCAKKFTYSKPEHLVIVDESGGLLTLDKKDPTDTELDASPRILRKIPEELTIQQQQIQSPEQKILRLPAEAPPEPPAPPAGERSPELFDHIDQNILAHPEINKILIFVQGGLNDKEDGIRRATDLSEPIKASGYYPLFIAWNANLFHTYREHLFKVRRGRGIDRVWGVITFPFYLGADLGRMITRSPVTWFHQFESDWRTDLILPTEPYHPGCPMEDAKKRRWKVEVNRVNAAYCQHMTNSAAEVFAPAEDRTKASWRAKDRTWYWLTSPFKLATAPAVDAMGKSAWDNMRRRTQTMFVTPGNFQQGGIDLFANHLTSFLEKHPNYSVTLVGHSMGAIVLNEIIRRHGEKLRIERIVYMAAACGVDEFNRSVVPFLLDHPQVTFHNLVLHPINEAAESHYSWGELPPRGSLLEWIDNFYSSAESEFGKTLGKWDNSVLSLFAIDPRFYPQIRVKAFDRGDPYLCGPQGHGEFSATRFWDPELWEPGPWRPELWNQSRVDKAPAKAR